MAKAKMTIDRAVKEMERRLKAVGKERDRLRDFEYEIAELRECCEEAYDDLERAIDALSRLV